jgi:hypothetical protein
MAEKAGDAETMEAARTRSEQWRSSRRSGKAPIPDELPGIGAVPPFLIGGIV